MSVSSPVPVMSPSLPVGSTAVIYCEGQFGEQDGKTANGLIRHSEKYDVLSVIDSRRAGQDAGQLLDGKANGIPVLASLALAVDDGRAAEGEGRGHDGDRRRHRHCCSSESSEEATRRVRADGPTVDEASALRARQVPGALDVSSR